MISIVWVSKTVRKQFQKVTISEAGITFYPSPLTLPREEMRAFWAAETPTGEKLILVGLKSPMFMPYFGTAWCFFRTVGINTE